MQPTFERGDPTRPRGHALVYFRATDDPNTILASYVVVPPIEMDFAKYLPPMFAAQFSGMMGAMGSGPSVFPLPPFPEAVESLEYVHRLAAARDDDLLDGGRLDPSDVQRMLTAVNDLAGEYAGLYTGYVANLSPEEPAPAGEPEALPGVDVDELLLTVMSEADKVGRLAKLTGQARYAIEGADDALLEETAGEMERVGRHLPPRYRVPELAAAAREPGEAAGRLAGLLLQRCYKLAAEEYGALEALDTEIDELAGKSPEPKATGEATQDKPERPSP